MPIWCHLTLMTIAQVTGFLFAVLASSGLLGLAADHYRPETRALQIGFALAGMWFVFFSIFCGARAGGWLVRRLTAYCPRCGGTADALGYLPVRYQCRECQHVESTSVMNRFGRS
jgi:hypothetical protein